MKRQSLCKKSMCVILCTVMACMLSACKKDVDYDIDYEVDEATESADTEEAEEDDDERIQETFYSPVNDGSITVDAEIKRQQGVTDYPVAKLKNRTFTDADIKKLAEIYFDENTVSVEDFWETGEDMTDIKWYDIHSDSDGEYNRYCFLQGTRNGIAMDMDFAAWDDEDDTSDAVVSISVSQTSEYGRGFNAYAGDEENTCTYTKEQALDVANSFLSELGFDDYADINICNASEYVSDGNATSYFVNGWMIDYSRSVNGAVMPYVNVMTDMDGEYRYEHINLTVTDDGVMEMTIDMPSEIEEISTEAAVLLSFDDMNSMAKAYFENQYLTDNDLSGAEEPMEINVIELGLAQITGDDGSSYLVPAWYYAYDASDGAYAENAIGIFNAIDGSVIKSAYVMN